MNLLDKYTPQELAEITIRDIANKRRKRAKELNNYIYQSVCRSRKMKKSEW